MNFLPPLKRSAWLIFLSIFLLSAWSEVVFAQPPVYVVTDLGVLPGYDSSAATSINNKGQVAGYEFTSTTPLHAFVWSDGVMTDLSSGSESVAFSINNNGQVAGYALPPRSGCSPYCGKGDAMLWQNGVRTDLSSLFNLGGGIEAAYINDSGQVAYWQFFTATGPSFTTSFLWESGLNGFTVPNLGLLEVTHINNKGQVSGQNCAAYNAQTSVCVRKVAAIWQNGIITNLATPPDNSDVSGIAYYINDFGQAVGSVQISGSNNHATFWENNGSMTDLGTLGGPTSDARSINSFDQIVGSSNTSNGGTHAFLYSNGQMIDLNNQIVDPSWNWVRRLGLMMLARS